MIIAALFGLALILLEANSAIAEQVKLAVTSSFHNSGLSDHLIPQAEADLALDIQLLVVGTGQAIKLGKNGDVDAILVHSRPDEEELVKSGFAKYRREIMFNEYVVIGPARDPAQISSAGNLLEVFKRLSKAKVSFVSRGDFSGTHKKEIEIWDKIIFNPEVSGAIDSLVGLDCVLDLHFLHITFPSKYYKGSKTRKMSQGNHQDSTINVNKSFDIQLFYKVTLRSISCILNFPHLTQLLF